MKTLTTTVARIVFAIPFLIFGLFHFMNADQMASMVPFPPEMLWNYLVGAGMIAAAIAFIIKKFAKLAGLLLALMLLIFILGVHLPGIMGADSQEAMMQPMQGLLKDMVIMGGALGFAGMFDRDEA
jgi:putative oxidoreductase